METIIRETKRPKGPFGVIGVGEMCMVPTAPAVLKTAHFIPDPFTAEEEIDVAIRAMKEIAGSRR